MWAGGSCGAGAGRGLWSSPAQPALYSCSAPTVPLPQGRAEVRSTSLLCWPHSVQCTPKCDSCPHKWCLSLFPELLSPPKGRGTRPHADSQLQGLKLAVGRAPRSHTIPGVTLRQSCDVAHGTSLQCGWGEMGSGGSAFVPCWRPCSCRV